MTLTSLSPAKNNDENLTSDDVKTELPSDTTEMNLQQNFQDLASAEPNHSKLKVVLNEYFIRKMMNFDDALSSDDLFQLFYSCVPDVFLVNCHKNIIQRGLQKSVAHCSKYLDEGIDAINNNNNNYYLEPQTREFLCKVQDLRSQGLSFSKTMKSFFVYALRRTETQYKLMLKSLPCFQEEGKEYHH